jgi:chemotaxis protein histidine kinase CheA
MRTLPTRMIRRRKSTARDGGFFKKENGAEQSFFADHAQNASFFQPSPIISRKCDTCEKEDKEVHRAADKKEEEKKIHKAADKKEDEKKIHKAADKKEEEKKINKAADKKEEEKKVHRSVTKDQENKYMHTQAEREADERKRREHEEKSKKHEKKMHRAADKKEDDKKVMRAVEIEENEEEHNRNLPVKHGEEDSELRLSEAGGTASGTANTTSYIGTLNSGGSKLPAETTRFFYDRMGYNFGNVNIHTGANAARSTKEVNAKAYAIDNHIVFNEGQYNPQIPEGKKLLAHELTHVVQNGDKAALKRAPDTKDEVQKTYSISVEKGDKDWTPKEVGIIKSALARLADEEKLAIKDYKFYRWTDKAARIKLDPSYHDPGVSECGLHEADIAKGVYKISMYDDCFGDPEAESDTKFGIDTGEFNLLHEIGHAMEVAEYKNTYLRYLAANKAYNDAIARYKDVTVTTPIKAEIDGLNAAEQVAEKAWTDANGRALKDFSALIKGKDNITEYAGTSPQEAFAEIFAAYKANPDFVKKNYAEVYQWLVAKGYFKKVPAAKGKKK